MWLLISTYLFFTILIAWALYGYFIFIWLISIFKYKKETIKEPDKWPFISIIITCYNEEDYILKKITNMKEVDYPEKKMEVLFVDGSSTDETVTLLKKNIKGFPHFKILKSPENGKIKQLNFGLTAAKGNIIFNTDTDATLKPDVLKKLVARMLSDENIFVVGAYCCPAHNALKLEQYHWNSNNKARLVESRAESSSIVVAPCYGFRKELIKSYPEDLIADDIYLAFLSICNGKKTIYCDDTLVHEERVPQNLNEFIPHKFRKANAFLRTSLRFLYRLPDMSPLFKIIFVTRIFQQLFLPWILLLWGILLGSLITIPQSQRYDIAAIGVAWIILNFLFCALIYRFIKLPNLKKEPYSIITIVFGLFMTMFILLITGISYPFYRPTSVYKRV